MSYKPFFIVLVGPSGVGKTTVVRGILRMRKDMKYSISATTRKKRKDELDGKNYYFLDVAEFKRWIEEDRFYEWAIVYGDYYGTPKEPVDNFLLEGYNVIFDLDVQGALSIKLSKKDSVTIFLLPPSIKELQRRLLDRGDKEDIIDRRIEESKGELNEAGRFDYIVKNESLEETIKNINTIIMAEAYRTERAVLNSPFTNREA